jgi:hypothetical protein
MTDHLRPDDPILLTDVLSCNDAMLATYFATQRIERHHGYPLRSPEDLRKVANLIAADPPQRLTKSGSPVIVSIEEAIRHFHPAWFPIRSRAELISRLLMGFLAAQSSVNHLLAEDRRYGASPTRGADAASSYSIGASGSLQAGVWTKVVWGWGFFAEDYQAGGSAFPVSARNYPLYREYTLQDRGCFTFQVFGYAEVWFMSAKGGAYSIALCPIIIRPGDPQALPHEA